VAVTVVLPQRSDLRYVDWASRRWLGPLLERGVQVVLQPPPFAHTKLFLVDGIYAQIGSANIDPRSLRLNFEIAVEIFDEQVCAILAQHIETVRARSQPVRLESLRSDSFPVRVRNGLSWLLSPYL
jgi:cardiolipin synthase